jgi:hypothetical protein
LDPGYEVQGEWVRRRERRTGRTPAPAFEILDEFDRSAEMGGDRLSFVDSFFSTSQFADPRFGQVEADTVETLSALVREAGTTAERWFGMYRLLAAVSLAGPARLKSLFRNEVAPLFFRLYPEGRIVVVRSHEAIDHAAASMRIHYALAQAPVGAFAGPDYPGMNMLQGWHSNSLMSFGQVLFAFLNHAFYPFIGGVRGGPPGLDFLFLLDPPERFTPRLFPRSWLALASAAADFGQEHVDFAESIRELLSPAWQRAAHQRGRHDTGFSAAERVELLRWYVGRVNRLLFEATDLANFTEGRDPSAPIDPVFAFEHYLTVDRILRRTVLSMSLEESGTAKTMAFEVADLYETLARRLDSKQQDGEFFKILFHPREGLRRVTESLARLPALFAGALTAFAERSYRRLQEAGIASVWMRSKVTDQAVLVRNANLTAERPQPHEDFVAATMRAYRNGHHGYFTEGDRNSKRRPAISSWWTGTSPRRCRGSRHCGGWPTWPTPSSSGGTIFPSVNTDGSETAPAHLTPTLLGGRKATRPESRPAEVLEILAPWTDPDVPGRRGFPTSTTAARTARTGGCSGSRRTCSTAG